MAAKAQPVWTSVDSLYPNVSGGINACNYRGDFVFIERHEGVVGSWPWRGTFAVFYNGRTGRRIVDRHLTFPPRATGCYFSASIDSNCNSIVIRIRQPYSFRRYSPDYSIAQDWTFLANETALAATSDMNGKCYLLTSSHFYRLSASLGVESSYVIPNLGNDTAVVHIEMAPDNHGGVYIWRASGDHTDVNRLYHFRVDSNMTIIGPVSIQLPQGPEGESPIAGMAYSSLLHRLVLFQYPYSFAWEQFSSTIIDPDSLTVITTLYPWENANLDYLVLPSFNYNQNGIWVIAPVYVQNQRTYTNLLSLSANNQWVQVDSIPATFLHSTIEGGSLRLFVSDSTFSVFYDNLGVTRLR